MTPEVERLLSRCGYPSQVEEFVNDILSTSPYDLTARLQLSLSEVQKKSPLYAKLDPEKWYVIAPLTPDHGPRVIKGRALIRFIVVFPDLTPPKNSLGKAVMDGFELQYARTFLEKLEEIKSYAVSLARAYELEDAPSELLVHLKDFLRLTIISRHNYHDTEGAADLRKETIEHIARMEDCLNQVIEILKKREQ